jgi:hypothetical protein
MELIPSIPNPKYIKNADDDCSLCLEEMKPKKNKLPIFDLHCADKVYHRFHIMCIMEYITKRLRLQASEDSEDSEDNDQLICPICSQFITMDNLKRINNAAQQYLYQLDVDQGVANRLFLTASIEQRNYKQLNQNRAEAIKLFRDVRFINFEYIRAIRNIFKHSEDYKEEDFLYYDHEDKNPAKAFKEADAIFNRLGAAPKTKVTRKRKRKRKRKGSRKG